MLLPEESFAYAGRKGRTGPVMQ